VSYNVARRIGDAPTFNRIATLDPNTTSYGIKGLEAGTTYQFQVRGILDGSTTPYSNTLTIAVPANPPAAPTSLRVENLWSRTIDLRWNDNSNNEQVFRIAMSTDGLDFDNIGTNEANDTSFRAEGLMPNTTYWFKVRAANLAGNTVYTNTIMVVTPSDPPTIPNPPSNCRVTEADPCSAVVRWDDNSNNEQTFRVAISKDGVNFDNADVVDANVTSVRVSNLCPETNYWVKVRARNEAGTSDYSNTAVFTTQRLRAPTNLVASRDTSTPEPDVVITWNLTGDCRDGYRLARSRDNVNFGNIAVLGPNVSSYRDVNVERDVRYYYKVRAYKECDGQTFFSDHSNTDSAIAR
jgi:titin